MMTKVGVEVYILAFPISALDTDERLISRSDRFIRGKKVIPIGSQSRSGRGTKERASVLDGNQTPAVQLWRPLGCTQPLHTGAKFRKILTSRSSAGSRH
jgi:hypothetical protein